MLVGGIGGVGWLVAGGNPLHGSYTVPACVCVCPPPPKPRTTK